MLYFRLLLLVFFACLAFYYVTCMLQMFGIIKFTKKNTEIEFPKCLIPFYYFFKL